VKLRCSANTACVSATGATVQALVYTGDGNDIVLSASHQTPGSPTVVLSWPARPQLSSVDGYDVFRGFFDVYNGDPTFATLQCIASNIPQATVGTAVTASDAAVPPVPRGVYYYLVGHSAKAPGALDALGRKSTGVIRVSPVPCP